MNNDPEIQFREVEERPKRNKSKKIHFRKQNDFYGHSSVVAYCFRKNARFFTTNWSKVDCHFCLKCKEENDEWEFKRKQEANNRIAEVSHYFRKDLYIPHYNESFFTYLHRVRDEEMIKYEEKEKNTIDELPYYNRIDIDLEDNIISFGSNGCGCCSSSESKTLDALTKEHIEELISDIKNEIKQATKDIEILKLLLSKR